MNCFMGQFILTIKRLKVDHLVPFREKINLFIEKNLLNLNIILKTSYNFINKNFKNI